MDPKTKAHQEALERFRNGELTVNFDPDKDPNGGWPLRRGRGVSRVARNIYRNEVPDKDMSTGAQC